MARAISEAGGPTIQAESDQLISQKGEVPVGGVVHTGAGTLFPVIKHVIHAVGPIWKGEEEEDETNDLLFKAVFRSLLLAAKLGMVKIREDERG